MGTRSSVTKTLVLVLVADVVAQTIGLTGV
jgi:hypothetical protein